MFEYLAGIQNYTHKRNIKERKYLVIVNHFKEKKKCNPSEQAGFKHIPHIMQISLFTCAHLVAHNIILPINNDCNGYQRCLLTQTLHLRLCACSHKTWCYQVSFHSAQNWSIECCRLQTDIITGTGDRALQRIGYKYNDKASTNKCIYIHLPLYLHISTSCLGK